MRDIFYFRAKTSSLNGSVSCQKKVDSVIIMSVEPQNPHNKISVIALGGGGDMTKTRNSTNPLSTKTLREILAWRNTASAIKGHLSHKEMVRYRNGNAAEYQEYPYKGAVIVLAWGEDTMGTYIDINKQAITYDNEYCK